MGGPANTRPLVSGGGHRAIRGTADNRRTEIKTGDETGQRALLERSMQEDGNEERSPPDQSHALNV